MQINTELLKSAIDLRELFERYGHPIRKDGKTLCPFHDERTPSCLVQADHFHCFGCGESGDLYDFLKLKHSCDFPEAVRIAGQLAGVTPTGYIPAPSPRPAKARTEFVPSQEDYERIAAMAHRLAGDGALCEKMATPRKWKPETLRELALEGSLGWGRPFGKDFQPYGDECLAFLYDFTGKFRWRQAGERKMAFPHGGKSLWRGFLLSLRKTRRVYLMEGETDAIAMLDAGAEEGGVAVVAIPLGAETFKPEWAPLFVGKEVTICFDNDPAGQNGTLTAITALKNYPRSLAVLDWKAVAA